MTDPRVILDDLANPRGAPEVVADPFMAADPIDLPVADETTAEMIRQKELEAANGPTIGQMFASMNAEQKQALLQTLSLPGGRDLGGRHALFIEATKVPVDIHLHWLDREVVREHGPRGYTAVRRTSVTSSWVPNCPAYGKYPYITNGTLVLGMKPMSDYIMELAENAQAGMQRKADLDSYTQSVLERVHQKLGLTRKQAKEADERGGTVLEKTFDPESLEKPDYVDADEVERSIAQGMVTTQVPSPRDARRERRRQ